MKVVASVQVRMGSTRLPGKVMKNIQGKPVLRHLLERVKRSKTIDEVVVNTSINPKDDIIEQYCVEYNISFHRGSEDDVLSRIIEAMKRYKADIGVTLFGDCPIVDPEIIDQVVSFYTEHEGKYDYVGNDLKTTFPPGLEVEVYSIAALEDARRRLNDPSIKEHGTLFIRKNPGIYRLHNIEAPPELHYPEMEIELDDENDFIVLEAIFNHFNGIGNLTFNAIDVVEFLKLNPKLQELNRNVNRLWKEYRNDIT
jgi:spore coat polysaccharide biosynthesis protein SpsF (cytidylyltransferase family)